MHAYNIKLAYALQAPSSKFFIKDDRLTITHRSMAREFSGGGQPQIPPDLDGAEDQPQAVWDPLRQLQRGGRGRVWSCHLNPQPAAAASAAGALP